MSKRRAFTWLAKHPMITCQVTQAVAAAAKAFLPSFTKCSYHFYYVVPPFSFSFFFLLYSDAFIFIFLWPCSSSYLARTCMAEPFSRGQRRSPRIHSWQTWLALSQPAAFSIRFVLTPSGYTDVFHLIINPLKCFSRFKISAQSNNCIPTTYTSFIGLPHAE